MTSVLSVMCGSIALQAFGRDRWRVRNPGLVDGNPRYIDHEFELVFYAVIGGKNHQSNPGPRGDAVIHRERNVRQIDEILCAMFCCISIT